MTAANHAIYALLWSSYDEWDRSLEDYEPSQALRDKVTADWESFREKAEAMGFDAEEHRAMAVDYSEGDEWDYAAHDFILTRNGHGAGFWDGGWHEPWGRRLTALAESFGEINCYLSDDDIVELY
jgi:hypothetical protein